MKSLVFDLQSSGKAFGEKSRRLLEAATAGAERCRAVTPHGLAIPTSWPVDFCDARAYPAAFLAWWYGDGAPNLQRDRHMLFEYVARMLLNFEELE